jgi:hypothetical protein
MENRAFNELVESIKEMGSYLRGEIDIEPSRIHVIREPESKDPALHRAAPSPAEEGAAR